jgi:superoxide dismutase, Cu-Zn family
VTKFGAILLPLALIGAAKAPPAVVQRASADLFNLRGQKVGHAVVDESRRGLSLSMYVHGLLPGDHGLHFHMTGMCSPPDFASAGAHWNPGKKQHGLESPQGFHAGDMPNIRTDARGTARVHLLLAVGPLSKGKNALLDGDGGAIVIHEDTDDLITDPSGNSGKRIVCGVLRLEQATR